MSPQRSPIATTPAVTRKTSFDVLEGPLAALQRAFACLFRHSSLCHDKVAQSITASWCQCLSHKEDFKEWCFDEIKDHCHSIIKFLFIGLGFLSIMLWIRWKFLYPFPFCDTPKSSLNEQLLAQIQSHQVHP